MATARERFNGWKDMFGNAWSMTALLFLLTHHVLPFMPVNPAPALAHPALALAYSTCDIKPVTGRRGYFKDMSPFTDMIVVDLSQILHAEPLAIRLLRLRQLPLAPAARPLISVRRICDSDEARQFGLLLVLKIILAATLGGVIADSYGSADAALTVAADQAHYAYAAEHEPGWLARVLEMRGTLVCYLIMRARARGTLTADASGGGKLGRIWNGTRRGLTTAATLPYRTACILLFGFIKHAFGINPAAPVHNAHVSVYAQSVLISTTYVVPCHVDGAFLAIFLARIIFKFFNSSIKFTGRELLSDGRGNLLLDRDGKPQIKENGRFVTFSLLVESGSAAMMMPLIATGGAVWTTLDGVEFAASYAHAASNVSRASGAPPLKVGDSVQTEPRVEFPALAVDPRAPLAGVEYSAFDVVPEHADKAISGMSIIGDVE